MSSLDFTDRFLTSCKTQTEQENLQMSSSLGKLKTYWFYFTWPNLLMS